MEEFLVNTKGYRFGFNGKEHDDETYGEGNEYDFGARIYSSRIGRFFSTDPKEKTYPWQSSYVYFMNSPILIVDINGEGGDPNKNTGEIKAKFVLINNGVNDADFASYLNYFQSNVNNFMNSGMFNFVNGNNEAIPISGSFIYETATLAEINSGCYNMNDQSVNYIYVNPPNSTNLKNGRSNAIQGGNVAQMNVQDRNNDAIHEVLHLFGLSDRYNFYQSINTNPGSLARGNPVIRSQPQGVPLALTPGEDPQYFGNENQNVMFDPDAATNSNSVTITQWNYVFNKQTEPNYGGVTTFFGIPQNVNVLNLPALRVQNQGAVYFRIQMINNQAQTITVGVTGLSWYQSGGASRGPSNAAGTNIFNTDGGQNYQAP